MQLAKVPSCRRARSLHPLHLVIEQLSHKHNRMLGILLHICGGTLVHGTFIPR